MIPLGRRKICIDMPGCEYKTKVQFGCHYYEDFDGHRDRDEACHIDFNSSKGFLVDNTC